MALAFTKKNSATLDGDPQMNDPECVLEFPEILPMIPVSPRDDCDHSEHEVSDDIRYQCLICGRIWYEL